LSAEIEAHLSALTDEYVARGFSPTDARLAARRAFGGVDQAGALYREQRSLPTLDALVFDLRTSIRVLGRERGFSTGVAVVLALGLTVNTTIFTIVNGMTWRSLPVAHGDRIVQIESVRLGPRRAGTYTSYADFADWRNGARTLADLAAYRAATMNLADDDRPADRLAGYFVTSNTFALLGVTPVAGRDFGATDDAPGAAPVAILAHHVWTARYQQDPAIVGRAIRINGVPTTVVGIMPERFQFPLRADAWRPLSQMPGFDPVTRSERHVDVVGRLRDGVRVEEARAEMEGIAAALAAQYRDTNDEIGVAVLPFTHAFVAPPPEAREPLIMMIAAAIVLLIACANGANLLMARTARRTREMALRATLGASRFRIVRQLLVEALLLSSVAAALGLAVSKVAVDVFARETADLNLPFWIAFEFDAHVFGFVAVACLGTAIVFGTLPAWQLSRTNTSDILKDGGRVGVGGRRAVRWTGGLLVCELALTLTLLGAASILVRSSKALGDRDAALDLDAVLTAQIGLPAARYDAPDRRRRLHAQLQEQLDRSSNIPLATLSSVRPFVESNTRELRLEGAHTDRPTTVQTVGVGSRYFETIGVRLLRGRDLSPQDGLPGREAVVINERLAHVYFPNSDPLGRRIALTIPRSPDAAVPIFTIVGISPSIRQRTMADVAPLVYMPLDLHVGPTLGVIARRGSDRTQTTAALREAIRAVDPDLAAYNFSSLRRLSELSRWPARMVSLVLTLFALIASALSAAGLYGTTAYGMAQRTSEIGLRVALGARRSQIVWFLLRQTLLRVAIGLVLGMAGVFAVGQLLQRALTQTRGTDVGVLAIVVCALAAITGLACMFPARRAVQLDPVVALRHE
jgi:predicted permease